MSEARTERPTPRRRRDARRHGRVPRSLEVTSALVLLTVGLSLTALGPAILDRLRGLLETGIARAADPTAAGRDGIAELAWWALGGFVFTVGPLVLVAAVVGLAANVLQVGLRLTPLALKPTPTKLNPVAGLKRLFGYEGAVEAAKGMMKTTIVTLVAVLTLWPRLPETAALVGAPAGAVVAELSAAVRDLVLRVGGAFLLVAAGDYAWQRLRYERSLRMTRDEVKQELRQTDLAPEIKRALRRRQLTLARKRMLADVPTADAVVVNPTHVAVALRYDGSLPAPEVVAKGAGVVAAAIRRVAEEHGVPVVHNASLARALYREVELGRTIPEAFFAAVAEVLAFVYRTSGRRPRLKRRIPRTITGAHAVPSSSPPH